MRTAGVLYENPRHALFAELCLMRSLCHFCSSPSLPAGGGNGLDPAEGDLIDTREEDEEGQEGLLAQLEEAFTIDGCGHQDRAKALEIIQVCVFSCSASRPKFVLPRRSRHSSHAQSRNSSIIRAQTMMLFA